MDNQLPDCDKARISDAKLFSYLLNPAHPDGKSKARFFELIGYTSANGEQLRADLLELACSGRVIKEVVSPEDTKYVVVGSVVSPNGKTYPILTVWTVEPPDNEPRLITAYPNQKNPA